DNVGRAYISGMTASTDFPLLHAYQTTKGGTWDAFVTRLNADGNQLDYSTYLGGSGDENTAGLHGYDNAIIAADSAGNAYVTGMRISSDFPTTANALQTTSSGSWDGFVAKIDTTQSGTASLAYST